jgi:hypothetical protein
MLESVPATLANDHTCAHFHVKQATHAVTCRAGFRPSRLLLNEAELVAALRTIPDIHVHQVMLITASVDLAHTL